jgi:hypothetical protein
VIDWSTVKDAPTRSDDGPLIELVEPCWRMVGQSGKVLSCGIYHSAAPGLEVRAGYGDDLLRSQRTKGINQARDIAATWKQAVLANGRFSEAP